MATRSKLQDDFLTCSICMEVFEKPVSLNCQHSFCQNCLSNYIPTKAEAVRNKTILCPTCRQETPVPHPDRPVEEWAGQLKPGLLLTGLMDSIPQDIHRCCWCQKEGKTTPATTWCSECQVCFCVECLKLHNKVPVSRHHDVSNLDKNTQQKMKQPPMCKNHDEKIKLFCRDCKKSLCSVCCSISHRKCEDVVAIQDILPEVKGQLMKRKEKLNEKAETNKMEIARYGYELDKFLVKSASVKTDISKTIQAAVDRLREKEAMLLETLVVFTDEQTQDLREKMKTKQTETQMYQQQSQTIQEFLELEDETQLVEIYLSSWSGVEGETTETSIEDKTNVADISFVHDPDKLKEGIEKMDLRSIDNTIDLAAKPVLHRVIDAKLCEREDSNVRDIVVIMSTNMKVTVLADFKNNRLKSIYQNGSKTCSSSLQVSSSPWCVTVIGDERVAVSLPHSQSIIAVAVTPDLELLSTVQTRKKYWGLSTLDQSTLVAGSGDPPSVDLIDMTGSILKTFTSLPVIGQSFIDPHYIHVTRQGTILVSDHGLKCVICLTRSGEIVFIYTPIGKRTLRDPCGITSTSTGDILVADCWAHKVFHLSRTGNYVRDIMTAEYNFQCPTCLCVDGDKLCVALVSRGVHIYKFNST